MRLLHIARNGRVKRCLVLVLHWEKAKERLHKRRIAFELPQLIRMMPPKRGSTEGTFAEEEGLAATVKGSDRQGGTCLVILQLAILMRYGMFQEK